jgi:hypothetical protein
VVYLRTGRRLLTATTGAKSARNSRAVRSRRSVGQSFFEPPGAVHLSGRGANTEPAELMAVFVVDEARS